MTWCPKFDRRETLDPTVQFNCIAMARPYEFRCAEFSTLFVLCVSAFQHQTAATDKDFEQAIDVIGPDGLRRSANIGFPNRCAFTKKKNAGKRIASSIVRARPTAFAASNSPRSFSTPTAFAAPILHAHSPRSFSTLCVLCVSAFQHQTAATDKDFEQAIDVIGPDGLRRSANIGFPNRCAFTKKNAGKRITSSIVRARPTAFAASNSPRSFSTLCVLCVSAFQHQTAATYKDFEQAVDAIGPDGLRRSANIGFPNRYAFTKKNAGKRIAGQQHTGA